MNGVLNLIEICSILEEDGDKGIMIFFLFLVYALGTVDITNAKDYLEK